VQQRALDHRAERAAAQHAAWQSAALVPVPSTAHSVSAHDMFCIVAMVVAPEPFAAQPPAPKVLVNPSERGIGSVDEA